MEACPQAALELEPVGRETRSRPSVREVLHELRGDSTGRRGLARRAAPGLALAAAALLVVAVVHSGDLAGALARAVSADWRWTAVGALLECASVAGYVLLLHRVVASADPRLRWRDSYHLSVGGTAATRLLPTAGLGGVGLTVWALRARGVSRRELAERLIALLVLLYSLYVGALVLSGVVIGTGIAPAPRGSALAVAGALVGVAVAVVFALVAVFPDAVVAHVRPARRAAGVLPFVRAGIVRALRAVREPRLALVGALAWWGFDLGVLGSMLRAFDARPAIWVLALAYFAGTLFNLIPLPGSLSGGLAAALVALGVAPLAAIPAVLAYRAVAIWLPAGVGLPSLVTLRESVARWRAEAPPS